MVSRFAQTLPENHYIAYAFFLTLSSRLFLRGPHSSLHTQNRNSESILPSALAPTGHNPDTRRLFKVRALALGQQRFAVLVLSPFLRLHEGEQLFFQPCLVECFLEDTGMRMD